MCECSGLAVTPNNDDLSNDIRANATVLGEGEGPPQHTITLYRDGFVVDDGPYRRLDDPSNSVFLTALASGMIPPELSAGGQNVNVGLVDKRNEDYNASQPQTQSFSGTGTALGGSAINATDDGVVVTLPTTSPPELDSSRPQTRIMIRLANGSRKVLQVNLDWQVSTILSLIDDPSSNQQRFTLSSGFPPTILTNYTQTIEEAGLKNAQIIQKLVA